MESSAIFSMGSALNRAKERELPVSVLVGNDWLRGQVLAVDSQGVMLETDRFEHCMIRLQSVDAMRVDAMVHA